LQDDEKGHTDSRFAICVEGHHLRPVFPVQPLEVLELILPVHEPAAHASIPILIIVILMIVVLKNWALLFGLDCYEEAGVGVDGCGGPACFPGELDHFPGWGCAGVVVE